jgi:hypothetical protein
MALLLYFVTDHDGSGEHNNDYFVTAASPSEAHALWCRYVIDERNNEPPAEVTVFVVPETGLTRGVAGWPHDTATKVHKQEQPDG